MSLPKRLPPNIERPKVESMRHGVVRATLGGKTNPILKDFEAVLIYVGQLEDYAADLEDQLIPPPEQRIERECESCGRTMLLPVGSTVASCSKCSDY